MTTNPFDTDYNMSSTSSSTRRANNNPFADGSFPTPPRKSISTPKQQSSTSQHPSNINDTNRHHHHHHHKYSSSSKNQDPIWEARAIEWPLMKSSLHLNSSTFNTLYKKSKLAGSSIGITISYNNTNKRNSNDGTTSSSAVDSAEGKKEKDFEKTSKGDHNSASVLEGSTTKSTTASVAGGYYGALGGLMGKLIGGQNQNISG